MSKDNPLAVEISERQAKLLGERAQTLGISLDELIRRILDEWIKEPGSQCPFRIIPCWPPAFAPLPSIPTPFPMPYTVTVYSTGEPGPFTTGDASGTITWTYEKKP